jgi:hypothetical protein
VKHFNNQIIPAIFPGEGISCDPWQDMQMSKELYDNPYFWKIDED